MTRHVSCPSLSSSSSSLSSSLSSSSSSSFPPLPKAQRERERESESDDEQKTNKDEEEVVVQSRRLSLSCSFCLVSFQKVPIKAGVKKDPPLPPPKNTNKTLNVWRVLGFYIRLYFRVSSKRYTFKNREKVESNPKSSFLVVVVARSFVRLVRLCIHTHISAREKKKKRRRQEEQQQEERRRRTTTQYGRIVGALAAPSDEKR